MLSIHQFQCSARLSNLFHSRLKNTTLSYRVKHSFKHTSQPRRSNLTPSENVHVDGPVGQPKLLTPFLFTIGFSGTCFCASAVWEYENRRSNYLKFHQRAADWMKNQVRQVKQGELRNDLNKWWNSLQDERKLCFGIIAVNAAVLGLWRIPSLKPFMVKYFCSNPFSQAVCWPMVLSTFSHYSALHFAANMYVLHSIAGAVSVNMGKEQFLGFYLSAGIAASFASHMLRTIRRTPGISLGASGALMGALAFFCMSYPKSELSIIFLPDLSFTAENGLKGLMALDTIGILLRWKIFDHAAHLGGALFGMFWYQWGQHIFWSRRHKIMNKWHSFRESPPSND